MIHKAHILANVLQNICDDMVYSLHHHYTAQTVQWLPTLALPENRSTPSCRRAQGCARTWWDFTTPETKRRRKQRTFVVFV